MPNNNYERVGFTRFIVLFSLDDRGELLVEIPQELLDRLAVAAEGRDDLRT